MMAALFMWSVTSPPITHRNADHQTPLHLAVDQDPLPEECLEVLELLLKQTDIDKDAQDRRVCDMH